MTEGSIIAIGDVHGCSAALAAIVRVSDHTAYEYRGGPGPRPADWPDLPPHICAAVLTLVGTAPAPDFSTTFAAAFDRLDREAGGYNFVSLVALRQALALDRGTFDGGLRQLRQAGRFTLSAAEGRHGITPEERAAAIEEGGTLLLYVSGTAP